MLLAVSNKAPATIIQYQMIYLNKYSINVIK